MSAAAQQQSEVKIMLTVVKGPHAKQVFQLNKSTLTIGRGPENDVVLMNDPQVSRVHAQISVVDRDLEISNLSQKNSIFVQGESVQRWNIVNNSSFTIGDSEIQVEFDLGKAVASVPAQKKGADIVPLRPKTNVAVPPKKAVAKPPAVVGVKPALSQAPARRAPVPGAPQQQMMPMQQMPMPGGGQVGRPQPQNFNPNAGFQTMQRPGAQQQQAPNSKMRFYLIIAIVIGAAYWFLNTPNKSAAKKIASTLKYEDEINAKLNSQQEVELVKDRELRKKTRDESPQAFRVQESFMRGMRDFQLGNYTRAIEFFQLVLNLDPDHALAKRHLVLSKNRFDELVEEKKRLGESYLNKHNFKMCESMYTQVMDMLQGKNSDLNYMLAEKKAKECALADEGIR